jgi:RNA polymerase sigma-70 factor (ECF subfamily)
MPANDKSKNDAHQNIERLVSQHAEVLYLYALMRVHQQELAEDIVQETLLAALQSWENFAGESSERTWLIGILRHKILDFFRQNHHVQENNDQSRQMEYFDKQGHWKDKPANWKADPAALAENGEFWKVLRDCLKELSKIVAEAFVMHELEGMTSEEICKHLEISETNLWVRLHRARLQLRRCLELNWFA